MAESQRETTGELLAHFKQYLDYDCAQEINEKYTLIRLLLSWYCESQISGALLIDTWSSDTQSKACALLLALCAIQRHSYQTSDPKLLTALRSGFQCRESVMDNLGNAKDSVKTYHIDKLFQGMDNKIALIEFDLNTWRGLPEGSEGHVLKTMIKPINLKPTSTQRVRGLIQDLMRSLEQRGGSQSSKKHWLEAPLMYVHKERTKDELGQILDYVRKISAVRRNKWNVFFSPASVSDFARGLVDFGLTQLPIKPCETTDSGVPFFMKTSGPSGHSKV